LIGWIAFEVCNAKTYELFMSMNVYKRFDPRVMDRGTYRNQWWVSDNGPKYALWDSNPGSWLAKEQKSRLRFGGRQLLLLNDEAWHCHPYTQAL
jgi:hypothetical protein